MQQHRKRLPALLPEDHGLANFVDERFDDVVRLEADVRHVRPSADTLALPGQVVSHVLDEGIEGGIVQYGLPPDNNGLQRLAQRFCSAKLTSRIGPEEAIPLGIADDAEHRQATVTPIVPVVPDLDAVPPPGARRDPALDLHGQRVGCSSPILDEGEVQILSVVIRAVDLLHDVAVPLQQRTHLVHGHASNAPALRNFRHLTPLLICSVKAKAALSHASRLQRRRVDPARRGRGWRRRAASRSLNGAVRKGWHRGGRPGCERPDAPALARCGPGAQRTQRVGFSADQLNDGKLADAVRLRHVDKAQHRFEPQRTRAASACIRKHRRARAPITLARS